MEVKKINIYKTGAMKWAVFIALALILIIWANFIRIPAKILNNTNILRGDLAYENNIFDDAEVFYRTALKNDPKISDVLYNLGNTYYKQERYYEAVQTYKEALVNKHSKLNAKVWNNLGNAYYMKGDLDLSELAYKNALLLNEDDTEIRRNLLFILSRIELRDSNINLTKKGKEGTKKKAGEDKKNDNKTVQKSDEPDGKPSDDKLSDNDIANLFGAIKQNELLTSKKISNLRSKNKTTASDDSDY